MMSVSTANSVTSVITTDQVLVVRRLDNVIRWINLYPVDSVVCFAIIYLLDSNLSVR